MRKQYLVISFVAILLLSLIEVKTYLIRDALNLVLFDNLSHNLSCKELPSKNDVFRILKQNEENIKKIIKDVSQSDKVVIDSTDEYFSMGNGIIIFEIGLDCQSSNTADIRIGYQTSEQRKLIQKYLKNNEFEGIPVKLTNY